MGSYILTAQFSTVIYGYAFCINPPKTENCCPRAFWNSSAWIPYTEHKSKIIAAGRQISDRHGTGLKFQFCEPLASASGLHARDAKTKNPLKYNNYSPIPVNKELFPFPVPQETKLSALSGRCGYKHFRHRHTNLISILQQLSFRQVIYNDPN